MARHHHPPSARQSVIPTTITAGMANRHSCRDILHGMYVCTYVLPENQEYIPSHPLTCFSSSVEKSVPGTNRYLAWHPSMSVQQLAPPYIHTYILVHRKPRANFLILLEPRRAWTLRSALWRGMDSSMGPSGPSMPLLEAFTGACWLLHIPSPHETPTSFRAFTHSPSFKSHFSSLRQPIPGTSEDYRLPEGHRDLLVSSDPSTFPWLMGITWTSIVSPSPLPKFFFLRVLGSPQI